jgi:hypothetical protein
VDVMARGILFFCVTVLDAAGESQQDEL